jgi:hypothetical protein
MFSRSYYGASATEFLLSSPAATVLGELVAHHTFAVDQNQRNACQAEIVHLQEFANDLRDSFFFLARVRKGSGQTLSSLLAAIFS